MIARVIIVPRREPLARPASVIARRPGNGARFGRVRVLLGQAGVVSERLLDVRARRTIVGDRRLHANHNPSREAKRAGLANSPRFQHGQLHSPIKRPNDLEARVRARPKSIYGWIRSARNSNLFVCLASRCASGPRWSETARVIRCDVVGPALGPHGAAPC